MSRTTTTKPRELQTVPLDEAGREIASQRQNGQATPQARITQMSEADMKRWLKLDEQIRLVSPAELKSKSRMEQALLMAEALEALWHAIDNAAMAKIMRLMNSPLGFMADRPNKHNQQPYGVDVVKACFIEALIMGVWPVGNEFNIIAERTYVTKNGYRHLLRDIPGLTDLKFTPAVPILKNGGAIVECTASWRIDGIEQAFGPRQIPVRTDQYSSIDQILGKAERKALAAIYAQATGSQIQIPDGEVEVVAVSDARSVPADGGVDPKPSAPQVSAEEARRRIQERRGNAEPEQPAEQPKPAPGREEPRGVAPGEPMTADQAEFLRSMGMEAKT